MNGASDITFFSEIEDCFTGLDASLSLTNIINDESGGAFTVGGSVSGGFRFHRLQLHDRVDADLFNGGTMFQQQIEVDETEATPTASAKAFFGYGRDNWSISASIQADYGKHNEYEINRPDSQAPNIPLPSTISLEPGLSYTGSFKATIKF